MPRRFHIDLPGIDPATVTLEHLHAAACGWLDDPSDHRAHAKPYAVSPPIHASNGTTVEIAVLTDAAETRLLDRVRPGTPVRLGTARTIIRTPPRPDAAASWARLASGKPRRAWALRFITPTTFRRGNAFTPAPSLTAILGSLRRTWQDFTPPELPPLRLDLAADPVWLTDIDVTSQTVTINKLVVSGFTGRLRFICDADDHTAAAIDTLVNLAEYAGVGAYTTRGFGYTRRETTWTPKTPRPRTPPRQSART